MMKTLRLKTFFAKKLHGRCLTGSSKSNYLKCIANVDMWNFYVNPLSANPEKWSNTQTKKFIKWSNTLK